MTASATPEREESSPGRLCPIGYRYGSTALAKAPEQSADTLYVVGGLYGNRPALAAVQTLLAAEGSPATLCFNGDFNWFDVDDSGFAAINCEVLQHDACLGNVEAELLEAGAAAGCGCAYPESVDADTVARSNRIHARLKQTARRHPQVLEALRILPMVRRYRVGNLAVGVVHGDAESLAGWRFDVEALDDPSQLGLIEESFVHAQVRTFACSHTCLPALRHFNNGCVINNGAAGMPNFRGQVHGVVTRIAVSPAPTPVLYGTVLGGVHLDAIALEYDATAWEREFLANWPPGSAAHVSYFKRIVDGPDHDVAKAAGAKGPTPRRASAREPHAAES